MRSEEASLPVGQGRRRWSTKKKDQAPRGVFRHPSGAWAIRFTCGAGHIHKERVGPIKADAARAYHDRRARAHAEAGWCPVTMRGHARASAQAAAARERARISFEIYARTYYLPYAKVHKRSWRTDQSRIEWLSRRLG